MATNGVPPVPDPTPIGSNGNASAMNLFAPDPNGGENAVSCV